jgi:hypothetical protein
MQVQTESFSTHPQGERPFPLGARSKLAGRRSVDPLVQADRLAPDMARQACFFGVAIDDARAGSGNGGKSELMTSMIPSIEVFWSIGFSTNRLLESATMVDQPSRTPPLRLPKNGPRRAPWPFAIFQHC